MNTEDRTISEADRISIINSLMQEDRAEIRMNKNILVTTTSFVAPGVFAVSAFAISQKPEQLTFYLIGMWSLFLLYLLLFSYLKHHLSNLRECLDIRESYYKDLTLLKTECPFNPLKSIEEYEDLTKRKGPFIKDHYLYCFPLITFLITAANTYFLLLIF